MESDLWIMLLKIIITLPFILGLIYLSLKYGGIKLQKMQSGRYLKILERVLISKENSLMVVKMGEKAFVVSSSNNKIEILKELEQDEILKIEEINILPQYSNLKDLYNNLKMKVKRNKND